MLSQMPTMISPENNDGILSEAQFVKSIENASDMSVFFAIPERAVFRFGFFSGSLFCFLFKVLFTMAMTAFFSLSKGKYDIIFLVSS